MIISPLVSYTNITDKSNARTHKIDTITPHCIVGQWTAKQAADYFKNNGKQNSVNYCIGFDGKISCSTPEDRRAWTSSSKSNDMRSVTVEIASDTEKPYKMTDRALYALVDLMVDICRRNGIPKLVWAENSTDRRNHKGGANVTLHRDFANTSCPGDFLVSKLPAIIAEVNELLSETFDWSSVKKGDTVHIDEDVVVYNSESDALKARNPRKTYPAGDYYVYKVSGQCVNISKNRLLPGGWILP